MCSQNLCISAGLRLPVMELRTCSLPHSQIAMIHSWGSKTSTNTGFTVMVFSSYCSFLFVAVHRAIAPHMALWGPSGLIGRPTYSCVFLAQNKWEMAIYTTIRGSRSVRRSLDGSRCKPLSPFTQVCKSRSMFWSCLPEPKMRWVISNSSPIITNSCAAL